MYDNDLQTQDDTGVENIYLPDSNFAHCIGTAHKTFTQDILRASSRGLKLECVDGNIVATRNCR